MHKLIILPVPGLFKELARKTTVTKTAIDEILSTKECWPMHEFICQRNNGRLYKSSQCS